MEDINMHMILFADHIANYRKDNFDDLQYDTIRNLYQLEKKMILLERQILLTSEYLKGNISEIKYNEKCLSEEIK